MVEQKPLEDAPSDKTFMTHLGEEIKSLEELSTSLGKTTPESFEKHVNSEKNDYANWVHDVLEDEDLSREMKETTDLSRTLQLVQARISYLRGEMAKYEEHEEKAEKLTEMSAAEHDNVKDVLKEQPEHVEPTTQPVEECGTVPNKDVHPFHHVKSNVHQAIMGGLIGFLIGAVVVGAVMKLFVCGP